MSKRDLVKKGYDTAPKYEGSDPHGLIVALTDRIVELESAVETSLKYLENGYSDEPSMLLRNALN